MEREPCPQRIFVDTGAGFCMGYIGGLVYHVFKTRRVPTKRFRMLFRPLAKAKQIGGRFGIWCFLFSTFDCYFGLYSPEERIWHSIAGGAATGFFLGIRRGPYKGMRKAVFGACILAVLEGVIRFFPIMMKMWFPNPGMFQQGPMTGFPHDTTPRS